MCAPVANYALTRVRSSGLFDSDYMEILYLSSPLSYFTIT